MAIFPCSQLKYKKHRQPRIRSREDTHKLMRKQPLENGRKVKLKGQLIDVTVRATQLTTYQAHWRREHT